MSLCVCGIFHAQRRFIHSEASLPRTEICTLVLFGSLSIVTSHEHPSGTGSHVISKNMTAKLHSDTAVQVSRLPAVCNNRLCRLRLFCNKHACLQTCVLSFCRVNGTCARRPHLLTPTLLDPVHGSAMDMGVCLRRSQRRCRNIRHITFCPRTQTGLCPEPALLCTQRSDVPSPSTNTFISLL